ncbi:hypothetical protein [Thiothrix unzii]|uniref:Uncharacterized protein n=1 Tax=Thiothrix unzii TaxID=111769 RepID=A0A975F660_9GAMM|nr:hypothetical protein [Thiothrix unzii]QTR52076.1 hypothetical protein J9260_09945 [Thiothrix unzii]
MAVINKLENQARAFKLISIFVLIIIVIVIAGAYKLFTTTSLDTSSTKIKNLQEEINSIDKITEINESIEKLKKIKFPKTQIHDFQNNNFYIGYIKDVSSLTYLEYIQINNVFQQIADLKENDDAADYNYTELLNKEVGNDTLSLKLYHLHPKGSQTYNNQILTYTNKIHDYNNLYTDDQYDSNVFISLKWVDDKSEMPSHHASILKVKYIFSSTYSSKDILSKFNDKTIANDAIQFNEFVDEKIKKEEGNIESIQKRKTELKNELIEEEDRVQKNQFYIYNSVVVKVATSIMLFLLVKMFMELFRYTLKMSVFYSTKANLIQLMYELEISDPEKIKDIFHSEAIDFQSPDAVDFLKAISTRL